MCAKPKILIPRRNRNDIVSDSEEFKRISAQVEFIYHDLTTSDAFKKFLPTSDIDALWFTEALMDNMEAPSKYMEYYPKSLKLIMVPWVGTDFYDGKLLKEKYGITLCNGGPVASENVSDLAIFLTLSCFRLTSFWEHAFRFVHRGDISKCREYIGGTHHDTIPGFALVESNTEMHRSTSTEQKFPTKADKDKFLNIAQDYKIAGKLMESPTSKNALILGFGSIGQAIGRKLNSSFNMKISYTKRNGPVPEADLGYEAQYMPSMEDELFWKDADLIVLALPGTPETEDIINEKTLSLCKNGVRIVNVGRGSCIDEDALLDALDSGKVASAGLDVFKNEFQQINPRFFERWDVTLLPHIGSTVLEILQRQTAATLENIDGFFLKKTGPKYPVN
ncbi:putative 2-hydroxyacid dehydrogenase YPL113C [Kluyveromyces marxianus]|uniref:2-hydroxyacid dehydrogenase YPL113C n=2 Tax=Kluyveromyces marxianus TaxID=4911 RepID=A0ABX6EZU3_KLUMA|nr:uncharacterized protein KLMA_50028 [Kluyveromyces marxianus DMKU3-1042]QGN16409.1 putative 2-hydroxyacid dehydrogenase YPL113C [Kluyveromyces marxianus]BAO40682.1 putative 2-hydroxyacid dehydrogenase YPL113C [Kluyveromyces marxianus DMKU3-1042]BAP72157.1 putative 2-hydroxyacid dehydrogenase YPL113C [Kluyveromyces marxianus]